MVRELDEGHADRERFGDVLGEREKAVSVLLGAAGVNVSTTSAAAVATTSFSADFTTLGVGPQATLPGGLALQRASTRSVQVSPQSVVQGVANDTACIGQITTDESSRGLSLWFGSTNLAYPSTPPATTTGAWSFVPGTGTATANNSVSPGGGNDATLYAVANNSSCIGALLQSTTPSNAVWSFWYQKQTATPSLSLVYSLDTTKLVTTYDTTWRRQATYAPGASSLFFDQRVANANPPMNTFLWGVQVESGKIPSDLIPTTTGTATRAGERLYLAAGATAFPNGIGDLNFELQAAGAISDYALPIRLLSDPNDSTTYIEITAGMRLNIVIQGTSWSPSAILNWKPNTDLKFEIVMGGVCSAKYSNGQGVVDLGNSGTALGLVTPSGAIEFCCSGTTQQFAGRIQRIEGYTSGHPAWVSQKTTSRQTRNVVCDGDSLTFAYGVANPGAYSYPAQMGSLLGPQYGVTNVGVSGQTLAGASGLIVTAPLLVDPLYGPFQKNITCIWAGTNDIEFNSRTAAQVWTDLQTYCAARKAAGDLVVVGTMLARDATYAFESIRQAYNTSIRGGLSTVYDALADVAGDSTIGFNGAQNNTTYFQADATHLTQAGQAIVASYFKAAVLSLG